MHKTPMTSPLPTLDAGIDAQLLFNLTDPYMSQGEGENLGFEADAETEDCSTFPSLPMDSLVLPLEGKPSAQEIKIPSPEKPAGVNTGYPGTRMKTPKHDLDVDDHSENTFRDWLVNDEDDECNIVLPTIEHSQVQLRDAKQILAEQAADRKRKRQRRDTEPPTPRKRARKARKSAGPNKRHRSPDEAPSPPPTHESDIPSHERHSSPTLPPSPIFLTPVPSPAPHEIAIVSSLLVLTATPLSPDTIYTTPLINSLTGTLWTALTQEPSHPSALGIGLWGLIQGYVSMWPYEKLRVLAHMGTLPARWWIRERLVAILDQKGYRVDDGMTVESWAWNEGKVKEWEDARMVEKEVGAVD